MPPEKCVYSAAIEALFVRELGSQLGYVGRRLLREAGLELERPLAVSYPLEQWRLFVDTAAEVLYPQLPVSQAHWWMGIHFMEGYLQTAMGRVLRELAPVLGPRRMLDRLGQELRRGNNFTEVRLTEHSPRYVELWTNDVLDEHASFVAGFIHRAQQMAGGRDVHVDVWSFDGTACTFLIRWRDMLPQAVTG